MSEKRKDNKGRILRTGREPEKRPDLSISVHRHSRQTADSVFLAIWKELTRAKKKKGNLPGEKQLDDGIDYAAGKINGGIQLFWNGTKVCSSKQGVRYNTKVAAITSCSIW